MKKRVGILTFHRTINYGGVLQCYALYKFLQEKGFAVDIIDYRPDYIEKWRRYKTNTSGFFSWIKSIVKGCLLYSSIRKANRHFDLFLRRMTLSNRVYHTSDFDKLSYDFYICGSDQIWNERITNGIDPIFWGNFNRNGARIVSYAASMGDFNLQNGINNITYELLKRIDKISVREEDLSALLTEKGIEAKVVVDPTLLADIQIFDDVIEKPARSNYVLVYALKNETIAVKFAIKIAEQMHSDVIVLRAMKSGKTYKGNNVYTVECVSPGAFLGYVKYSLCNIIISFHGTVFSTLYKKDFYSLQDSTQGRYEHYLNKVGLKNRLVNPFDSIVFSKVDYSAFDNRIQELKINSTLFINSSLFTDSYEEQN